jgi:hypothetical protein
MKKNYLYKPICRISVMLILLNVAICAVAQQYQNVTVYTPNDTAVLAGSLISGELTSAPQSGYIPLPVFYLKKELRLKR